MFPYVLLPSHSAALCCSYPASCGQEQNLTNPSASLPQRAAGSPEMLSQPPLLHVEQSECSQILLKVQAFQSSYQLCCPPLGTLKQHLAFSFILHNTANHPELQSILHSSVRPLVSPESHQHLSVLRKDSFYSSIYMIDKNVQ